MKIPTIGLLLSAMLSSCVQLPAQQPTSPQASVSTPPIPADTATPKTSAPDDPQASPSQSAPPQPVAQASPTSAYQTQGSQNGTPFTVRVIELKRVSGNSLLMRLALTNNGQQSLNFILLNVTQNDSIYIVDPTEQKKAYPLKDSSGSAVSSKPIYGVDPEATIEAFAQFPAPPASTQRLTVYFPSASPILDVPITP